MNINKILNPPEEESSYLEPEFAKPFNEWKTTPTPEKATTLLKAVHPVLTAAMRSYGTSSPTLTSRAKVMALDAMDRYDPTKAKLRTHLMFQLQGLRRHTAKEQQALSMPEQVGLDLNKLRLSENELRDQLGRDPSDAELADHTMLSMKRINYIRKSKPSYSEGSMQRFNEEGEDVYSPGVETRRPTFSKNWLKFVYHDLSPIDQVILEHTLGMGGKDILQNQELAKKLNISPGAVSQRKAKIQGKLDLRDTLGVI